MPSADKRVNLTGILLNVKTFIQEDETRRLSAESMAKLEFNIKNLVSIDIEEGMSLIKKNTELHFKGQTLLQD